MQTNHLRFLFPAPVKDNKDLGACPRSPGPLFFFLINSTAVQNGSHDLVGQGHLYDSQALAGWSHLYDSRVLAARATCMTVECQQDEATCKAIKYQQASNLMPACESNLNFLHQTNHIAACQTSPQLLRCIPHNVYNCMATHHSRFLLNHQSSCVLYQAFKFCTLYLKPVSLTLRLVVISSL